MNKTHIVENEIKRYFVEKVKEERIGIIRVPTYRVTDQFGNVHFKKFVTSWSKFVNDRRNKLYTYEDISNLLEKLLLNSDERDIEITLDTDERIYTRPLNVLTN